MQFNKLHGHVFLQVPQTANRKTICLVVVVSVNIAVIVVHVPVVGIVCIVLGRTPPVAVVSNVVECSIVVTVASRKGCKSNHLICCTGIFSLCNLL